MGQYVKRSGKTYYKGDDGKLYKDYSAALAAANQPQTGFEYGLSLLGVRPDRNQQSGLEYGMKQLAGLAGVPGQPETGLQYGLQQAGNLFNRLARGANAQELITSQADQSLLGRVMPPGSKKEPFVAKEEATIIPAGTVQPTAIVKGLTPTGTVDYTQGDEYKSQMAQYQNLINQKKTQEAEDLGMKIWMDKYGKTPMGQAGGAIGAYNPLLAATFPETKGFAGTFATPEEVQMGDLGTRAQGEMGPTMETLNPLASQAAQQEATAMQADMATTAGMSTGDRARNLTRAFRLGMM